MLTKRALWAWLGVLGIAGCVSVDEPVIQQGAIEKGQRSVLLVFAAPGPWVTPDTDTKVETAGKLLPGLGQIVQGAQDSRDLKTSKALALYMPNYSPRDAFYPVMRTEVGKIGFPGVWISTGDESETTPELLDRFNRSGDVLDWRTRYYTAEPEDVRPLRNYSTLLSLDQALVLEVNLQHGLLVLDDGSYVPALSAYNRLYRAGTMKLLWYHEESVDDRSAPKGIEEYMGNPKMLTDAYGRLMPALAAKISNDLRTASSPAASTAAVAGLPLSPAATAQFRPGPQVSTAAAFAQPLMPQTTAVPAPPLAPHTTGQAPTPPTQK